MNKYRLWMWIGVAVIVIALIVAAFFVGRSILSKSNNSNKSNSEDSVVIPDPTREEVPANTVVPGADAINLPAGVAKPENVKLSGGESSPYLKNFNVTVKNNVVSPDNIISYVGDIITLSFESKDKAYDFIQPDLGIKWQVPASGSKTFQFQTYDIGKFIFYCPSCGGPKSGPVGYIIAAPR